MTAVTTIKVFGLKEYDEVIIPVENLPAYRSAFESMMQLAGKADVPVATACLNVLGSALLTNGGDTPLFSDEKNRESIAQTVFIFASHSNDPKYDPVRGNFILVEATFQNFNCTIYGSDQERNFRDDVGRAREHHRNFLGVLSPYGHRGQPSDRTLRTKNGEPIH